MARVLRHQNQENAHFNMKKVAPNRLGKRAMPKYKNIRKGLPLFCFPIIDSIKQINLQRFSVVKGTMTQTFFNALHLTPSNRTKYLWNRGTKFGTLQSYKITFGNDLLFALFATEKVMEVLLQQKWAHRCCLRNCAEVSTILFMLHCYVFFKGNILSGTMPVTTQSLEIGIKRDNGREI